MPLYNQGKFLKKMILSNSNQNHPNLKYIIIAGASFYNFKRLV